MPKKEYITAKEIEKDILRTLRKEPDLTEKEYHKYTIPAIILAVLLVILEIVYPLAVLWGLLALVAFAVTASVIAAAKRRRKRRSFSFGNYTVTTEVLDSKDEEQYVQRSGGRYARRSKTIYNYTLHFENGKSWRIPNDNYTWSGELPMSEHTIYHSANNGDKFIVVTETATGEIAMAYHTAFFEYKKEA